MRKLRKRARPLSKASAISRADDMLEHVQRDVYWALEIEVAMEAANEVIQAGLKGKLFYGATTFNVVSSAMAIQLSLALAKLFEVPTPRQGQSQARAMNGSDVASLPLLVRLLKQKRCRDHYVALSRGWSFAIGQQANSSPSEVDDLLDQVFTRYGAARRDRRYQLALSRVREFRNNRVAHSLLRGHTPPIYNDLHMLMDLARDTLQDIRLAMTGINSDLLEKERFRRDEAHHFWSAALPAAIANKQH